MKTILWLLLILLAAGCSREEPPVGGGERKIHHITILAKEHRTLLEDKNPTALRVGARLPLRVVASWAIPYVEDVTDKVELTVNPPAYGDLDTQAVFTARSPGKVVIDAVLRVAQRPGGHEVLAPNESPGADPVIAFTDRMELTVIGAHTAASTNKEATSPPR